VEKGISDESGARSFMLTDSEMKLLAETMKMPMGIPARSWRQVSNPGHW
jgi:hypothetical protein